MRNRPLFIVVCLVFLAVCAGGLLAEEEKVTLPDSPLVDEKEKEAAPPAEEKKPAEQTATAVPFLRPATFYMGLHAGASFGLGGFEEPMGVGYEIFFSFRYQFTPNISALAAASMFALGSADGVSGVGFFHLSLDGRYTIPLNENFYGYLQLGGSGYTVSFTEFSFGYNAGMGAGWIILPDMALELGVDYNATFQMENMFLQVYFGAVFKM